jgi:hypothetical protein
MFIYRPVLDLIDLEKLSFKNDEISTLLSIKINNLFLKLFKSVNDFEEVSIFKEEAIVSLFDSFDNFFNWIEKSILIKVCFESTMLELLKSEKIRIRKLLTHKVEFSTWRQYLEQDPQHLIFKSQRKKMI